MHPLLLTPITSQIVMSEKGLFISILWCAPFLFSSLQQTPDGRRKIVDLIDATGSGDVDTTTVRKTEGEGEREIKGLSGRNLKIPNDWENPSGEWRIGIKAALELFPNNVKNRLQVQTVLTLFISKCSRGLSYQI